MRGWCCCICDNSSSFGWYIVELGVFEHLLFQLLQAIDFGKCWILVQGHIGIDNRRAFVTVLMKHLAGLQVATIVFHGCRTARNRRSCTMATGRCV